MTATLSHTLVVVMVILLVLWTIKFCVWSSIIGKKNNDLNTPLSNVPFHLMDTSYVAPALKKNYQLFDPIEAARQEARDRL